MKILAIDTSSKVCSVAITEDDKKIIELHSDDEKTHSVKLMPMIDEAFQSTNLNLNNIDLLACCVGPGSFTGVRIGIATVKAFSDSKNIPVVGVSSLEGLAYNMIYDSIPSIQLSNTLYCSLIDAKNNNVYCGLYRYYNDCLNPIMDLMADNIETIISTINTTILTFENQFKNIVFVGDGSSIYKEKIKNEVSFDILWFSTDEQNMANSVNIAVSGHKKFLNGDFGNSHILSPLYLRKSQAEQALDEKDK